MCFFIAPAVPRLKIEEEEEEEDSEKLSTTFADLAANRFAALLNMFVRYY